MKKILLLMGLVLSSILVFAHDKKSNNPIQNAKAFAESFLQTKKETLEQRQALTKEEREIEVGRVREDEMKPLLLLTKEEDYQVARALNIYMKPEEDFAVEVAFDYGFIKQVLDEIAKVPLREMGKKKDNADELLKAFAPLVYLTNAIAEKGFFEEEKLLIEVYMGRMRVSTADKYRLSFREFIEHYRKEVSSREYGAAINTFLDNVEKGEAELLPKVREPSQG